MIGTSPNLLIPFSHFLIPMLLISSFSLVSLGVPPHACSALLCGTPHVALVIHTVHMFPLFVCSYHI